ncbi:MULTISPECIES: peptidogalycan biosysnthesis protein [Actinomadura]|uniref:Peptidogalycan biosysnthesis/recognition n=1 Tax=Actinomadura madurae TaxID=1993 RepID=A0A1I5IDY8_9ACTN|nr:peptidogalycan biosysnthesis protein [Actinomadura madurae]SFO58702.1 Peptidogalycan biosysnthesis/recognition [Actinomadura madurae]
MPPVVELHTSIAQLRARHSELPVADQNLRELERVERLRRFSSMTTMYLTARTRSGVHGLLPLYPTSRSALPEETVARLFQEETDPAWRSMMLIGSDATAPNSLVCTPDTAAALVEEAVAISVRHSPDLVCFPHLSDAQHAAVRPCLGADPEFSGEREEAYFDLRYGSFDEYVMSLPRQRRSHIRRERRLFRESRVTLRELPPAEVVHLEPYLTGVESRYGVPPRPELQRLYLRTTAQAMGDRGTALVASVADRPIAFTTLWDLGSVWRTRVWGCDDTHPLVREAAVYFNLMYYEPIIRADAADARRLYVGTGTIEAKTRRGARVRRLRSIGWAPDHARSRGRSTATTLNSEV